MTTLICLLFFTAFLVWMCTSKKSELEKQREVIRPTGTETPTNKVYRYADLMCCFFALRRNVRFWGWDLCGYCYLNGNGKSGGFILSIPVFECKVVRRVISPLFSY